MLEEQVANTGSMSRLNVTGAKINATFLRLDWLDLFIVVSEEVMAENGDHWRWGRGRLYLSLHCQHHSDSALSLDSGEITVRGKVTKAVVMNHYICRERGDEEESNRGPFAYNNNNKSSSSSIIIITA